VSFQNLYRENQQNASEYPLLVAVWPRILPNDYLVSFLIRL